MSNILLNKIELLGNEKAIAACAEDLQAINNGERKWKDLGIDGFTVRYVCLPFYQDVQRLNYIEVESSWNPCEDLFECLCGIYNLHGTIEYQEFNMGEFGEFEICSEGEKYWRALTIDEYNAAMSYNEEIGDFEPGYKERLRDLLNGKEKKPWIKDPRIIREKYAWAAQRIKYENRNKAGSKSERMVCFI